MKPKKDKSIQTKVTAAMKAEFEQACEKNGTTPSHELRQFIRKYISSSQSRRITMR